MSMAVVWALALVKSEDYARAGVPMLPNVAGDAATRRQILLYTLILVPAGLLPYWLGFGGAAYAQWYTSGGSAGIAPTDPMLLRGFDLLRSAASLPEDKRTEIAKELWRMLVDEVWSIGLVGQSPAYMGTRVVNERLENVPARTCTSQHCRTPWSGHPEQWYYK